MPWSERLFTLATQVALLAIMWREIVGDGTIAAIGSYNLGTYEFILVASIVALVANFTPLVQAMNLYLAGAIALVAILVVNVIRGCFISPLDSIIAVRLTGPSAVFLLLAPLVPRLPRAVLRIRSSLIIAGVTLAMLAIFRRTTGLLLSPYNVTDGRPMLSWGGLLIAIGCILLTSELFRIRRRRNAAILLAISYVGLVVTGQGTANLCGIMGCGLVFALEPGRTRLLRLILVAVFGSALAAVWLFAPDLLSLSTLSSIGSSEFNSYLTDRDRTNSTRQYIWQGLWESYKGWQQIEQILGLPSGVKPVVYIPLWNGTLWQYSMHSTYLQTLVSEGMLGLVIYVSIFILLLIISFWRALMNLRPVADPISPAAGAAILLATMVFGYSYDLGGELAPLSMLGLGSALWAGSQMRPRRLATRAPATNLVR